VPPVLQRAETAWTKDGFVALIGGGGFVLEGVEPLPHPVKDINQTNRTSFFIGITPLRL
jgi:hypothetical protein